MLEKVEEYFEKLTEKVNEIFNEDKKEGFLNQFDFNQTCLLITLIFVVVFMYKKEIMKMLNLK